MIIDSGASISIINNIKLFITFRSLTSHKHILTANGGKMEIHGVGIIENFGEAYYVPSATKNLISVSQLTKDGAKVTFTNNGVFLNGKQVGRLSNNLYAISNRPEQQVEDYVNDGHQLVTHISIGDLQDNQKLKLLHKRFAHTNISDIKELIRYNAVEGLEKITHRHASPNHFTCEACSMCRARFLEKSGR